MYGISGSVRATIMVPMMVIVPVSIHGVNIFPVMGPWMRLPVGIGDSAMSNTMLPIPRSRVNPGCISRTPRCILVRTLCKSA